MTLPEASGIKVPWPRIHCVSSVMTSPGIAIEVPLCRERRTRFFGRESISSSSEFEADGMDSSDDVPFSSGRVSEGSGEGRRIINPMATVFQRRGSR